MELVVKDAKGQEFTIDWGTGNWGGQFRIAKTLKDEQDENDYDYWGSDGSTILEADLIQEETCCGFDVLGNWSYGADLAKEDLAFIGKSMKKAMGKQKYVAAYVPHTKAWKPIETLLEAAGFVPGAKVKSNHGRYKNIRWEYCGKGSTLLDMKKA